MPDKGKYFVPLHSSQTGSEGHSDSYPLLIPDSFSGDKEAGIWADHSFPSNAEARNMWSYASTATCCGAALKAQATVSSSVVH